MILRPPYSPRTAIKVWLTHTLCLSHVTENRIADCGFSAASCARSLIVATGLPARAVAPRALSAGMRLAGHAPPVSATPIPSHLRQVGDLRQGPHAGQAE